jgi:hypothetical protein
MRAVTGAITTALSRAGALPGPLWRGDRKNRFGAARV